jgi:hypothetical protein
MTSSKVNPESLPASACRACDITCGARSSLLSVRPVGDVQIWAPHLPMLACALLSGKGFGIRQRIGKFAAVSDPIGYSCPRPRLATPVEQVAQNSQCDGLRHAALEQAEQSRRITENPDQALRVTLRSVEARRKPSTPRSRRRGIAEAAVSVCSVVRTRCPVSAARTAI